MSSTRVKICGITSLADARTAVAAGADAMGFMFFAGSPRHVTPAQARGIIAGLPTRPSAVGVFVNPTAAEVEQAVAEAGLDALQFHGEETPEFIARLDLDRWFAAQRPPAAGGRWAVAGRVVRTIKAFRIRDVGSLPELTRFTTDLWLLDSYVASSRGGTGARFDWDLAVAARELGRPIILAGGLTPENVAAAVRSVRPFAVDVSSGVESAPGRKDPALVQAFIQAAQSEALVPPGA